MTRAGREMDGESRGETRKETGVNDSNLAREAGTRRARGEEDIARHVLSHVVLPDCSEMQGVEQIDEATAVQWHPADSR